MDSVSAVVPLPGHLVVVQAERAAAQLTTGRYAVVVDNQLVAAATSNELMLGAPSVAFVSTGEPSVLLLSTYTGGQGAAAIPGYYLKLVVLASSGVRAFTLDSETVGEVPSDRVLAISRPADGQFTLTIWGGLRLRYVAGRLEASTSP
jgi:hypothetical protein